jgi:uncharacterized protein
MRLSEIHYDESKPIDGYGPGFFRVGGTVHRGTIVVTPQGVKPWGGFDDAQALLDLAEIVDVIFVGTGADVAHLPADFRSIFDDAGIGIEPMASPPACRTYNVLLSEGRRVAAALLPV